MCWSVKIGLLGYHGNKSWITLPGDHRVFSSNLYTAKPSTANTVAPTLALSQKVELVRSSWIICLLSKETKINTQIEGNKERHKRDVNSESTGRVKVEFMHYRFVKTMLDAPRDQMMTGICQFSSWTWPVKGGSNFQTGNHILFLVFLLSGSENRKAKRILLLL